MRCFIYKSLKKDDLYLYLTKKDDFSYLPDTLYQSVIPIEFVMELELTPQRKLARENPEKVIESLNAKGFFIQMPPTQIPASQQRQ